MAYGYPKDLPRVNKVLCSKAFNILKIQNMMDINVNVLQFPINILIKILLVGMMGVQINPVLKAKIF